jgi:hypothetical protein
MSGGPEEVGADPARLLELAYQPPRVERVLTPAGLEREVQYAGRDVSPLK